MRVGLELGFLYKKGAYMHRCRMDEKGEYFEAENIAQKR